MTEDIEEIIATNDPQIIANYIKKHKLVLKDGTISNPDGQREVEYWDKRQLVKKINLNS
jgi:hypothetical protein